MRESPTAVARSVPTSCLTPREREVAALVAEGLSNAEIGERLMLRPGAVSSHLGNIMRRLGVRSRIRVAIWAVRQGLDQPR
jgi:DNA-binding CsgD family transcriptional regulator